MPPRTLTTVALATARRPRTTLARVLAIRDLLADDLPAAQAALIAERGRLVAELHAGGATWEEIGDLFGVSRQRAQQYGTP